MSGKRQNYLSWDEYFMSITSLASLKSVTDYSGVCIVDANNRILAIGVNDIPYTIKSNYNGNDQFNVTSLSNALYTFRGRRQEFENGTIYLSHFPNCEESRQIVQAKIKKVYFLIKDIPEDIEEISNLILECGHVKIEPYFDEVYPIKEYKNLLVELKKIIKSNLSKEITGKLINDEYFMGIASLSALRSKDPSTQVGACLVDNQNRILSIGYNGAPFGIDDDILPWDSLGEQTGDLFTTKDPYIVHAEMNAFDNYRGNQDDLKKSKLYLTYSPCIACSKRISIAGLERIIYYREYKKNNTSKISSIWLNKSQTICEPYYDDKDISKEEYLKFFDETTNFVKKYLKK